MIFLFSRLVLFVAGLVVVSGVLGLVIVGLAGLGEGNMRVATGAFSVSHDMGADVDAMD